MEIVIYILYTLKYDITLSRSVVYLYSQVLLFLINSVFFFLFIYFQFWITLLIIIYLCSRVRMHLIKYRVIIVVTTATCILRDRPCLI
jgi:hypothetical protein